MKFDWSKFLALIESHPADFAALVGTIIKNPAVIPGLVGLAKGGSVVAWVEANQGLTLTLLSQAVAALQADPTLLPAILTAVSA